MKLTLFLGDDSARRLAAFELAAKEWRSEVSPMDFDVFDLADPQQAMRAAGAVRMPPLDGPARVVIWKNLQALGKPSQAIKAEFEECIPQAHPDVLVIAEAKTGAATKGKAATLSSPIRPLAAVIAKAETKGFSKPAWWDNPGQQTMVIAMAKEVGVSISADLAGQVLQMVGADTGRISAAFEQLAQLGEPASKRLLRSLLEADQADLEAFHLLAVQGKTREALQLIPQFETAGLKPAEAIIKLQNLAIKTLAVSSTRAKDDASVSTVAGIPERQLYFRRKEWARIKASKAEAALAAATDLAGQLSTGRRLALPVLLRTYLALSRVA